MVLYIYRYQFFIVHSLTVKVLQEGRDGVILVLYTPYLPQANPRDRSKTKCRYDMTHTVGHTWLD